MKELMIEVQKVENKGRGIIATQDIPKGKLIEAAPVVILPPEQIWSINETTVFQYYFVRILESGINKSMERYLVFGLVSLCNHSEEPNARVNWIENEMGVWSHLIAKKDIKRFEEVTLFYTNINDYLDIKKFV